LFAGSCSGRGAPQLGALAGHCNINSMRSLNVLVLTDSSDPQLATLRESFPGVNIFAGNSVEQIGPGAAQATIIFNWSGSLDLMKHAFRLSPNLLWVHSRSVGLERSLFPELIESSVTLTNGLGVFSPALGEFVLAAILYFAKDFRQLIRNQNAGVWRPFQPLPVSGATVGIIGFGDIGRAVATRVRSLGMTALAVRRHAADQYRGDSLAEQVFPPERRIEMIERSDYIVVATPLTPETRAMVGAPEFAAMKPHTVLINVGRGPVIDEQQLVLALTNQTIKGAALDVFDHEPLPQDHPFYKLDNVLLSPHCADNTPDWLEESMKLFMAQLERFQRAEPLLHVVDKKLGY
jgi:phosphoglycerate dehydrogenase-like enzyme